MNAVINIDLPKLKNYYNIVEGLFTQPGSKADSQI
jgi:hypothetical protein